MRLRRAGRSETAIALDPSAILIPPWSSPPRPKSSRRRNAPCRSHGRVVLCQIVRAEGSTPGKMGWKLLARPDGTFFGNLGGGAFEALVKADALAKLRSGGRRRRLRGQAVLPDRGGDQGRAHRHGLRRHGRGLPRGDGRRARARRSAAAARWGRRWRRRRRSPASRSWWRTTARSSAIRELFPAGARLAEVDRRTTREDFLAPGAPPRALRRRRLPLLGDRHGGAGGGAPRGPRGAALPGAHGEPAQGGPGARGARGAGFRSFGRSGCTRRSACRSAATARAKSPSRFWRRSLVQRYEKSACQFVSVPIGAARSLPAASPGTPASLAASAAPAAGPDWSYLPIWGGDVWSSPSIPQDPDMVFAGTSAGQIYLSRNGGRTWVDAGPAPAVPRLGGQRPALRSQPTPAPRLGGAARHLGRRPRGLLGRPTARPGSRAPGAACRRRARLHPGARLPGHEGRVYAGTLSGVYGTEDGGDTWRRLTADLPEMQKVTSLLVDADQPDTRDRRHLAPRLPQRRRRQDLGRGLRGHGPRLRGVHPDARRRQARARSGPAPAAGSTTPWTAAASGSASRRASTSAAPPASPPSPTAACSPAPWPASTSRTTAARPGAGWATRASPILSIAFHPAQPNRVIFGTEGSGVWISEDGGLTLRPSAAAA